MRLPRFKTVCNLGYPASVVRAGRFRMNETSYHIRLLDGRGRGARIGSGRGMSPVGGWPEAVGRL